MPDTVPEERASYVAVTVREILDLMHRNGEGGKIDGAAQTQKPEATIDPTKNVLDKVEDAVKRIDDIMVLDRGYQEKLRNSDLSWANKLDAQKERSAELRFTSEQSRTDALRAGDAASIAAALQTAATAALALQAQVTQSATTLATAAQLNKDTQDKAIAALQLVQAQSGSTLAGREVQSREGFEASKRNTVTQNQVIYIAFGLIAILFELHRAGVI
jgi:hypothetical protein